MWREDFDQSMWRKNSQWCVSDHPAHALLGQHWTVGCAQTLMLSIRAWLAWLGLSLICVPTPASPAVEAVHSFCLQLFRE